MSWGERSCIHAYSTEKMCHPEMDTCNVNCQKYEWDGIRTPDSIKRADPVALKKARSKPYQAQPPKGKIGRNEPCLCGSGFKYKKCHGAKTN
jgi:hypothetical protein